MKPIKSFAWQDHIIRKLILKHQVEPYEVEETHINNPKIKHIANGNQKGEDLYRALKEKRMAKNREALEKLLEGKSEDELGKFFDEHDIEEYLEAEPLIDIKVSPNIRKSKRLTEEEKQRIIAGEPVKVEK